MTYPEVAVAEYVTAHFVPLRLDLDDGAQAAQARVFVPLWTPTLVVADGRGREAHREVGFLPPEALLPRLALGRAKGLFATARGREATAALDEALERWPVADSLPELLYWRGALGHLVSQERAPLERFWGRLRREFPESTWSVRTAFEGGE